MRLKGNYQLVADAVPFYKRTKLIAVFDYVPMKKTHRKTYFVVFFAGSYDRPS
jgi:hypothetical protein